MKTFTIVISGTFQPETEEQAVEIIQRIEAAGRQALAAVPSGVVKSGALTYGAPERAGAHIKGNCWTVDLALVAEVPEPVEVVPADVTDPAPAS